MTRSSTSLRKVSAGRAMFGQRPRPTTSRPPATDAEAAEVGHDAGDETDVSSRPASARQANADNQAHGVEPVPRKVEGLEMS